MENIDPAVTETIGFLTSIGFVLFIVWLVVIQERRVRREEQSLRRSEIHHRINQSRGIR